MMSLDVTWHPTRLQGALDDRRQSLVLEMPDCGRTGEQYCAHEPSRTLRDPPVRPRARFLGMVGTSPSRVLQVLRVVRTAESAPKLLHECRTSADESLGGNDLNSSKIIRYVRKATPASVRESRKAPLLSVSRSGPISRAICNVCEGRRPRDQPKYCCIRERRSRLCLCNIRHIEAMREIRSYCRSADRFD
jgi:hypothetical protein